MKPTGAKTTVEVGVTIVCSRNRFAFLLAVAGAVLLMAVIARPGLAADRPNILFIMTDQQSADVMSCRMGNQHINTPAMDSLASSGTLFTRAYTANPLCMPARTALFTGQYPHRTGVTRNACPPNSVDRVGEGGGDQWMGSDERSSMADLYQVRFGDHFVAMNTTVESTYRECTFTFDVPFGPGETLDLVSGERLDLTDPVRPGPRSTVVLYFGP